MTSQWFIAYLILFFIAILYCDYQDKKHNAQERIQQLEKN